MRIATKQNYLIPRRDVMRIFKIGSRLTLVDWENLGKIPEAIRDSKGWTYYSKEHIRAIAKRYLQRGRELPPEAIELLKNNGIDPKELGHEINEEEEKKNCGDQSFNRESSHGQT